MSLSPNLTTISHQLIQDSNSEKVKIVGAIHYFGQPKFVDHIENIGNASSINIAKVVSLKPDVVLAFQGGGNALYVAQLKQLGLKVKIFKADTLYSIGKMVESLGQTIGLTKEGQLAAEKYWQRLEKLKVKKSRVHTHKPSVFVEYGLFPLYTAGDKGVMNEVVEYCGGENIFKHQDQQSFPVSKIAVLHSNPDVILSLVVMPPNGKLYQIQNNSNWKQFSFLSAVKHHQIYDVDPNLLSQMTPEILKGVGVVCELLTKACANN